MSVCVRPLCPGTRAVDSPLRTSSRLIPQGKVVLVLQVQTALPVTYHSWTQASSELHCATPRIGLGASDARVAPTSSDPCLLRSHWHTCTVTDWAALSTPHVVSTESGLCLDPCFFYSLRIHCWDCLVQWF